MIGRKTLKSGRARARQIDIFFERTAQVMLLVYALFAFVSWLSYRPAFHINEVVIEGLHAVSQDGVIAIADEALASQFLARVYRNNMLLYPKGEMLDGITALDPRIAAVSLSFDSRHTLRIAVKEYTVGALYCQSPDAEMHVSTLTSATATGTQNTKTYANETMHCYYADEHGYVFAEAVDWSGHPYMTFVSSSSAPAIRAYILPEEEYVHVNQFLSSLIAIDLRPHTVTILGNNDFRVETPLPWDILWSSKKDAEQSTENLGLVLASLKAMNEKDKKELEVIDLRFGDKIFYK